MADTTFAAKATKIVSTWLQAVNDRLYGGKNPIYVTTGGSANAYTLTLPATSLYAAYAAGDAFTFKASFTNTGAATLSVIGASTLAAKAITLAGTALTGGELSANQIFTIVYDDASQTFQLQNSALDVSGITSLGTAGALSSSDYGLVSQSGVSKKTLLSTLADWIIQTYAGFLQSGTGGTATTVQDEIRRLCVTPQQFGAKGDGITDDTAAIQAAIDALKNAKGGILYIPPGNYLVTAALNLANLGHTSIVVKGAGRGDGIYNTTPLYGSNLYGRTGAQAVLETQGSEYLALEDFGIYSLTADSSCSVVGIFLGRTTVQNTCEFHHYRRLNIILATKPTANGTRGSIGLYNLEGEHGQFDEILIKADTPMVQYDDNALTYVPTYGTLSNVASSTLNSYRQCAFISLSAQAVELRGAYSTTWLDCYYGTNTGASRLPIAVVCATGSGPSGNLRFLGGQAEVYDSFIQLNDAAIDIKIDVTFACPGAAGPMCLLNVANNQAAYGLDLDFGNSSSLTIAVVTAGAATGVTMYGGKVVLKKGSTLDAPSLKIVGTDIVDLNTSGGTIAVASGSAYTLRRTASGMPLVATGAIAKATQAPTYSASITVDASVTSLAEITVTDANAFTINAPTNPTDTQKLSFAILNSSGGAMGTVTFASAFRTTGSFTSPASTKIRTIEFQYDGSHWLELNRASADL